MNADASQPESGADASQRAGSSAPSDGDPLPVSRTAGWPGRFFRLCRKELREVLRDRRTIITLIGMPLLVYPLLSLTFQKFLLTSAPPQGTTDSILGFENESQMRLVRRYLDLGDEIWQRQAATRAGGSAEMQNAGGERVEAGERERAGRPPEVVEKAASDAEPSAAPTGGDPASALLPSAPLRLLVRDTIVLDLEQSLARGEIDVGVRVLPADGARELPGFGSPLVCELWFRDESALSRATFEHVTERLELINRSYVRRQLAASGLSPELPAEIRARPLATGGSPLSLTTVVPLILILMTITGAVYPAIDVTAGERERGTMEALMAAPVPRLALLGAKYVAVLTVAVLTAVANLLAMTVTLTVTPWGRLLFDSAGISPLVIAQVFGLLILFAAFFSALLLAITSFARSFKEAQAYLIPLMLVSLAPGIISLMPGLEFRGALAVTPLVNMVLLARALLEGQVPAVPAAVAVLSTGLYTIASIGLAARIFGTDALLSGSRFGWQDLFLRPAHARPAASPSGALA
ncbi:MAG: ABC transporter permease, partial [Pirellulaceae bacterium]|nr:ABC transporter permease [Pirellulaceae bacterium]